MAGLAAWRARSGDWQGEVFGRVGMQIQSQKAGTAR